MYWWAWQWIYIPYMLLSILVHFIFDSIALLAIIKLFKIDDKRNFYLKTIWKTTLFGAVIDFVAKFLLLVKFAGYYYSLILQSATWKANLPAVILISVLMFLIDYFVVFRKNERKCRIISSFVFSAISVLCYFVVILIFIIPGVSA